MAMQGCDLVLRVGAQKSKTNFWRAQNKPKILWHFNFCSAYFLERGLFFFGHKGGFLKLVLGDFQSLKKAQNSSAVYF